MSSNDMELTVPGRPSSSPSQAFLFRDDEVKAAIEAEEAKGNYTGDRLKERKPELYQAIVVWLAEGKSHREIERALSRSDGPGVTRRTITAVEDREPEAIKAQRDHRIKNLTRAADYQLERLLEHPGLVPMQFAADTLVKLSSHAQLLSGQATSRVEHTGRVELFDDWEGQIAKMLQPGDVIEIEANPITPALGLKTGRETGFADGKKFPIGIEDRNAGIDSASEDRQPIALERSEGDTVSVTSQPPRSEAEGSPGSDASPGSKRLEEARQGRGGGGSAPASPPNSSMGKTAQKFSGHSEPNPS